MTSQHALLIVNRKSGNSDSDLNGGLKLLEDGGLTLIKLFSSDPKEINTFISQYADQAHRVIIGGGDGTISAAARELVKHRLTLGILPMGTANDLARTLSIPTSVKEACRIIAQGRRHHIDIGMVNDHYFLNVAHIGLGVGVTHHLSHEIKNRWGILSYARSVLEVIKNHRPFSATIHCDGHIQKLRTTQIAVGNGRHYGGGMTIADHAAIDDHLLHLYSLHPHPWWTMVSIALAIKTGHLQNREGVYAMCGREIDIQTNSSQAVSADGEIITHTPVKFRVLSQALSVYVPDDYQSPYTY
ncbi:MAG TPA: lipid kinase [Nitrospirales bacterium]|nr:lipid kinase [Nitrospiraceae bacterium]HNP27828.1 lipid kinase [Nitrospirales bacterium]